MYIDPGTGSLLIQGLVAAIAGGLLTFRLWWHKLASAFRSPAVAETVDEEREPED